MFQGNDYKSVIVNLDYDPAADDVIPLWRVPLDATIMGAYATMTNALAANGTNYFSLTLRNGGTAGTATTAISDTIGGTAGWSALVPTEFTMSADEIGAGELVQLVYDEEGTGTFTAVHIQLDVVYGSN